MVENMAVDSHVYWPGDKYLLSVCNWK